MDKPQKQKRKRRSRVSQCQHELCMAEIRRLTWYLQKGKV
jgi:hypothetical protein